MGALLFATSLLTDRPQLLRWAVRSWVIGGAVLLLFGAMNHYTHIGMYFNITHGTLHSPTGRCIAGEAHRHDESTPERGSPERAGLPLRAAPMTQWSRLQRGGGRHQSRWCAGLRALPKRLLGSDNLPTQVRVYGA